MEEKVFGVKDHQKNKKSNNSLMAIDEYYYKIKSTQKLSRCKSANVINNSRNHKLNSNHNNFTRSRTNKKIGVTFNDSYKKNIVFNNDALIKEKNNSSNSVDLPLYLSKNSKIFHKNSKPNLNKVNMSSLFRSNDSTRIDSAMQSTKNLRVFPGKSNSNNNIISGTKLIENKKKIEAKKKLLSVVNINPYIEKNKSDINILFNKITLQDLRVQKLIKKSKMVDFNKPKDNSNFIENIQKAQIYDLMPLLLLYMKQKENEKYEAKKEENLYSNRNEKNKNKKNIKFNNNYPVKFSFLNNAINNIHHLVNFVDIDNKEEVKQNVIKEYKVNNKIYKNRDFKAFGYELDPEVIKKIIQNEKQKEFKEKLKELKNQELFGNLQKAKHKRLISPKEKRNNILEDLKLTKEFYKSLNKKWKLKDKKILLNKNNSTKEINYNINKQEDIENNISILDHGSFASKGDIFSIINNNKISDSYFESNKKMSKAFDLKSSNFNNNIEIEKNQKENLLNDIDKDKDKDKFNNKLFNNINYLNLLHQTKSENSNISKNYQNLNLLMTNDNKLAVHSNKNEEKQNKNEELDNNYVNLNTNNSFDSYKDLINIGKSIKSRNNKGKNKLHLSRIKPKKITFRKMTYFNNNSKNEDIEISSNISIIDNKSEALNLTPIKDKKKVSNDNNNNNNNDMKDKNSPKNKKKRKKNKNKKNIKNSKNTKNDKKSNETLPKDLEQKNKNKSNDNKNLDLKITNNKENNINNPANNEKNEIKEDISNKNQDNNKNNNNKNNNKIKSPIKNKEEEENEIIEKIEENLEDEDNEEEGKKNSEDIRSTLAKNQLNKSNKFIEERRFNSLNYLFSQKYKEQNKNENNIEKETKEPNSPIKEVNINTIEDIEYKKNVLLYKMKEDIKSKIKEGKYDMNDLENFNKFEDNINQYHLNHGSKDINQVKDYFLLLSKKFSEYQEIMNDKETRLIEQERINKFLADLNFELDYNIPEALMKKGRRCRSSNLYKRLITLSEITKKLNDLN